MQGMWKLSWVLLIFCGFAKGLPRYLKRHMNVSANPCEDFYAYACGGWPQAHDGRDYSSQVEQLDHMYHGQLSALLEQQAPATEPRFVQLLRNNYAACRQLRVNYQPAQFVRMLREWMSPNTAKVDQEGGWESMTPLLRLLVKFGWLNYFKWRKEDGNMLELTEEEQWLQKLQLFWPRIGTDSVEWQGDEADFLPLTHAQFRHLYRALKPLGVTQEELWQQVKQLEQMLWDVTQYDDEEIVDMLPEEQKEQQFDEVLEWEQEELELEKWKQLSLEEEEEGEEEEQLQEEDKTPLMELSMALYDKWNREAYPGWLLPVPVPLPHLRQYLADLPSVLLMLPRDLLQRYLLLRLLHKLQQMPPLNISPLECAAQTRLLLPHATDWILEQQLSQAQRLQRRYHVKRLFALLRQQFKQLLLANRNHFDRATQRFLLCKLRRIRLRLGLLPTGEQQPMQADMQQQAEEQQLLEQRHAPLQLNASDYFGNLLAMFRQYQVWTQQEKVETLHDRRALLLLLPLDFGTYASPFFMPVGNLLVLPPSLLASPIYRAHQGDLYRLSSLGFLMSHEMSHSLAPTDVLYDGRGTQLTSLEDNMFDSARFDDQLRCLLRRYHEKTDEKFADLNGIALAYKAYMATSTANQQQQQRFFINFAQFFCRAEQQEQLEIDIHGSNRQRVNEAVSSLEGFATAFGCALDKENRNCQLY